MIFSVHGVRSDRPRWIRRWALVEGVSSKEISDCSSNSFDQLRKLYPDGVPFPEDVPDLWERMTTHELELRQSDRREGELRRWEEQDEKRFVGLLKRVSARLVLNRPATPKRIKRMLWIDCQPLERQQQRMGTTKDPWVGFVLPHHRFLIRAQP
jgi:hypothetical protein